MVIFKAELNFCSVICVKWDPEKLDFHHCPEFLQFYDSILFSNPNRNIEIQDNGGNPSVLLDPMSNTNTFN